jgi:succinyl-diaminopimelate desuccinylase
MEERVSLDAPWARLMPLVQAAGDRIVDFLQRLVRVPSLTGDEAAVAALVEAELHTLGIGDTAVDASGNVLGHLAGASRHQTMLHAHLDVVDPSDPGLWTYAPFAGQLAEGHIWGRGSADDKGSVAAQVYALGLLHQAGLIPPGDVLLAAVVGEEIGGLGSRFLSRGRLPDIAIIGEPSSNTLRRGHRGRFEFIVTFHGRSAHASAPHLGCNPNHALARFITALDEAPMAQDSDFGDTTAVPTLLHVDQTSSNVIPAAASVHLDWRNAPGESLQAARDLLDGLIARCLEPGITAEVRLASRKVESYTGMSQTVEHAGTPFWIAADDPRVLQAQRALQRTLGRAVPVDVWTFFTDGGFLYAAGAPCIGFGPGDPAMAHVKDERISVQQLLEATAGYMALALAMGAPQGA